MPILDDIPERYDLANELHARPFPEVPNACQVNTFQMMIGMGEREETKQ